MVLLTVPLAGTVQAATPMRGWMMHDDGGSAWFQPNELPDPFERDFGNRCKWWRYELKHGHYVLTYHVCRYGDQEVSYDKNVRASWQEMLNPSDGVVPVVVVAPSTALEQITQHEAVAASGTATMPGTTTVPGTATMPALADEAATGDAVESQETAKELAIDDSAGMMADKDIAETLVEANDYLALLIASGASGLTDMLHSEGPYTLFAPHDTAFAELPEGGLEELMANPSGELARIVKYHVVDGVVTTAEMIDGEELETLEGSPIIVTIDGDSILVNGAAIVDPDIRASNGVIHVIEAVLQPPSE